MCDALSRNIPKEFEIILANCLSHGRRNFVDVISNFPDECRYVLETLSEVYRNDQTAKEQNMTPEERLKFHQTEIGPLMEDLHAWFNRQLDEKKTEPNSGLGKRSPICSIIGSRKRHWTTTFANGH
jgi:transposase